MKSANQSPSRTSNKSVFCKAIPLLRYPRSAQNQPEETIVSFVVETTELSYAILVCHSIANSAGSIHVLTAISLFSYNTATLPLYLSCQINFIIFTFEFPASCPDIPRVNQDHTQIYPVTNHTFLLLHSFTTVFNLHVPPDTYAHGSDVHDGNCITQVDTVGKSIICHNMLYGDGVIPATSIQSPTVNPLNVPVYVACFNVSSHVTSVITSSIDCTELICLVCLNIP